MSHKARTQHLHIDWVVCESGLCKLGDDKCNRWRDEAKREGRTVVVNHCVIPDIRHLTEKAKEERHA